MLQCNCIVDVVLAKFIFLFHFLDISKCVVAAQTTIQISIDVQLIKT